MTDIPNAALLTWVRDQLSRQQEVTLQMPPDHRLYERFNDLTLFLGSLAHATAPVVGGGIPQNPTNVIALEARQFDFDTFLYFDGRLEAAINRTAPENIRILFRVRRSAPTYNGSVDGFRGLIEKIISIVFANLHEEYADWIEEAFGSDAYDWPQLFNFFRVVRNAIAHRGRIYFKNQNALPVKWQNLSYAPGDTGRLLSDDLSFADLMFLMLEIGLELDNRNAPIP
jgi:hypothetical protein